MDGRQSQAQSSQPRKAEPVSWSAAAGGKKNSSQVAGAQSHITGTQYQITGVQSQAAKAGEVRNSTLPGKPSWTTTTAVVLSSSDDSGSDVDEESKKARADVGQLEESIFGRYLSQSGRDNEVFGAGVDRIREHLLSAQSGATTCLICLEKVRGGDSVWDCQKECFCIFHLECIQAWARQSAAAAALRHTADLPPQRFPAAAATAAATADWHCPKCRSEYAQPEVPKHYSCFCGKQRDPPFDPWLAPHTCGEACGRPLPSGCGHSCTLLCHPGPCPPCPQLVTTPCYCGGAKEVRRCGKQAYACKGKCKRQLACGKHRCKEGCHPGECPPCPEAGLHSCRCGRLKQQRTCAERDFSCETKCGHKLPCQRHTCEKICHAGSCGPCPLSGRRCCPCGKADLGELPCDAPTTTCGSTCEKLLGCGRHRCPERCHLGPCADTCRLFVTKPCRCGGLKKQVACSQDVVCERKCQRVRPCGRHACKRRCCEGDCPPCPEVCAKKLRCGNHKCVAPCHDGPCAPCQVTLPISCACGSTVITVPCGAEQHVKPPRCTKPCQTPPACRHAGGVPPPPHRCHYRACPPCGLPCNSPLPCGHSCPERCHGPRPPAAPEYSLRPKKAKKGKPEEESQQEEWRKGRPCPPCVVPVPVRCLGGHETREMPCWQAGPSRCGRPCGKTLACTNHTCANPCHQITRSDGPLINVASSSKALSAEDDTCQQCERKCEKPRDPPCDHPCPLRCHPGGCPTCKAVVRRKCHCEAAILLALDCCAVTAAEAAVKKDKGQARDKLLSCGNTCSRKLPYCSHLCPEVCHAGACPRPSQCKKKAVARCPCRRLRKEVPCFETQAAQQRKGGGGGKGDNGPRLLECDAECKRVQAEKRKAEEMAANKEVEREEGPSVGAANAEAPSGGLGKGRRRGRKVVEEVPPWWEVYLTRELRYRFLLVVCIVVGMLLAYKGAVGLKQLSDWMNDLEATRQRSVEK